MRPPSSAAAVTRSPPASPTRRCRGGSLPRRPDEQCDDEDRSEPYACPLLEDRKPRGGDRYRALEGSEPRGSDRRRIGGPHEPLQLCGENIEVRQQRPQHPGHYDEDRGRDDRAQRRDRIKRIERTLEKGKRVRDRE